MKIKQGLFISTIFFLVIACGIEQEKVENEPSSSGVENISLSEEQFKTAEMELGKIETRPFYKEIRATGVLDVPPSNRAEINVYFGGYVKQVDLLPGDRVKKGDVLFVLEDPNYLEMQSDYLQSKDELKYLKSDYERQMALIADSISSKKQFLKAEETYLSAKARYQSLYQKLKMMNYDPDNLSAETISSSRAITSPISGTVSEMHLNLGSYVKPNEKAICILSTDHMHLELKVFERDIADLAEGQKILFHSQNNSEKEYEAEVHLINRQVNSDERSLQLHGHFLNDTTYPELIPGMYLEARILTDADSLAALPLSAVIEKENKFWVAVQSEISDQEMTFEIREVIPARSSGDFIAIKNADDFHSSDKFIINGAFNLIKE